MDIFEGSLRLLKKITWKDILIVVLLCAAFFATRLYQLDKLPIFTDEAIYIHWAKLAWRDAAWRFVSLTDGRQPLQTWATIPFLKLIENPLIAGRMFGVSSGFITLLGTMLLAAYLFRTRFAAYTAGLFIVFHPMFIFYDRMALVDSTVVGIYVWILLLSIITVRTLRLDSALIWGGIMGFGLLAKSSVRLFMAIPLFAPMLLPKASWRKILAYYALLAVAVCIAFLIYNIQRLSPFMHFIEQKNLTFVRTISQVISQPFNPTITNIWTIPYYLASETGYFIALSGLVGLLWYAYKEWAGRYIFLWFIVPYMVIAVFAVVLFPRYIAFMAIPLIIGYCYILTKASKRWKIILVAAYLFAACYPVWLTITQPPLRTFPPIDRGQYFESETVGNGINDIVFLLKETSKTQPVVVYTEGTFGLLPYALDIYTSYDTPNITYKAKWPLTDNDFEEAQNDASSSAVFLVIPKSRELPDSATLLRRFERFGGKSALFVYQIRQRE